MSDPKEFTVALRKEIEALRREDDGMWHAEDIVSWASSHPESELHKRFTWDDVAAANEHRLEQARRLIRLHIVTEAGEPRAVSLTFDRNSGGGYRDISDIGKRPDLMEIMLRDAMSALKTARQKYSRVQKLSKVWQAIDAAQPEHQPETRREPEQLSA